jgi:hypothetical protein
MPENGELETGNLTWFPVVPGRVEFAAAVRRAIVTQLPQVVAVQLPGWLEPQYRQAVDRLPQMSVIVAPDPEREDEGVYLTVEPADPFVEAVRTGLMCGAEVLFLEPDTVDRPHASGLYPDTHAVRAIGSGAYIGQYRELPPPVSAAMEAHAASMAWKLQGADPLARILVVVSLNLIDALRAAMETPQDSPPARRGLEASLINPHPECLAEITLEMPYLQERYEHYRLSMEADDTPIDRRRVQFALLREAETSYEANTGDKIAHWQRRMMARYTRNLALTEQRLVAGLFDLTLAARAVVDDNYAWEVWETANRYSWQQESSELETLKLSGEEVFVNARKLRLRPRQPRMKQKLLPRGLKRRQKESKPGEWAEQVGGSSICSYPPEDIVVEDYGRSLKRKARSILSEERRRVEPFRTSALDGIDIRETIRNWHESKIYVRQLDKIAGDVGAVVVIFDEDKADRYQYLTTWLGEHQNESDMAFYATNPFDHVVGPGIGRAEYGGFLMVLPPRRMYDVWNDADYEWAESKPERLLLAALDYSLERHVVYVAHRPPRSIFRSIAAGLNRSILYIPMGQLSPANLKRIRVVHVLDSHERRATVKKYLW